MAAEKLYIPQSLLALRQELEYNPTLKAQLVLSPASGIGDHLALIATHCGIVVDGYFSEEGLERLAAILTERLHDMRAITID